MSLCPVGLRSPGGALAAALATLSCMSFSPSKPPHDLPSAVRTLVADDSGSAVALHYEVRSHDGRWTYEVVTGPGLYAERRSRCDGAGYSFGTRGAQVWLQINQRPPVAVQGTWTESTRTRAGLFGLGFLRPKQGDVFELVVRTSATLEYAYRPAGGETLHLLVDRRRGISSFDTIDPNDGILSCGSLRWERRAGRSVLAEAHCSGIVNEVGQRWSHFELQRAEAINLSAPPTWTSPSAPLLEPRPLRRTAEFPLIESNSPRIPVTIGDQDPVEFVVDSGAFATVISASAARRLGVVPTGEVPLKVKPPWLKTMKLWVGLTDRLTVGEADVHGARLLVMEDDSGIGGAAGLLGADFFERYIVDVDSPARKLRIAARETFRPAAGATRLRQLGNTKHGMTVWGEVADVAAGPLVLDTGAELDVVVNHWGLKLKHPRTPGSDVFLSVGEGTSSPDYATAIDGLRLGPFEFPAMDAVGRDRDRDRIGGVALVGMGLLRHFRVAFDARDRHVYLWPGDSYKTLVRAGVEIDDREKGPTITRVVPESLGARSKMRVEDVVVRVEGKTVHDAQGARRSIGSARSDRVRVDLRHEGVERSVDLWLEG